MFTQAGRLKTKTKKIKEAGPFYLELGAPKEKHANRAKDTHTHTHSAPEF